MQLKYVLSYSLNIWKADKSMTILLKFTMDYLKWAIEME